MKKIKTFLFLGTLALTCSAIPSQAQVADTNPIVFADNGARTNIKANRASGNSYVNPFRVGVVNLGSDSAGSEPGATGNYSTVVGGDKNSATGDYSVVGGYWSVASGNASNAFGDFVSATGHAAHAEGYSSSASAEGSHAEGWNSYARARFSHVEGASCATGESWNDLESLGAHAEGTGCLSGGGIGPHAEGYGTIALGNSAHAEGTWTRANKPASHAEGEDCEANAWRSHAEGAWTETRGIASHSQGLATRAVGYASSANGDSSIALRDTQWSLAGGNFLNDSSGSTVPPPARGDSQTSLIVMRAQSFAGEESEFKFGTYRSEVFNVESDKAYDIRSTAVLAGSVGGMSAIRLVNIHALVTDDPNGIPNVTLVDQSTSGDDFSSTWQVSISGASPHKLSWKVSASNGAKINAVLRVEFTEVTFP